MGKTLQNGDEFDGETTWEDVRRELEAMVAKLDRLIELRERGESDA